MTDLKNNVKWLNDLATSGYDNARRLGEINVRNWEGMVEKQMEAMGFWLDVGIKQVEITLSAKDPKTFMDAEVALVKELREDVMAKGREAVKVAGDAGEEYRKWYEAGVSELSGKLGKVAAPAA